MPARRPWLWGAPLAFAMLFAASGAAADPLRLHLEGGAARAAFGTQANDTGWGFAGGAALELALSPAIGIQLELLNVTLSAGQTPSDPTIAPKGASSAQAGQLGVRFRPFGASATSDRRLGAAGLWLAAGGGGAKTGQVVRPAFGAELGYDLLWPGFGIGPFVGYEHVIQKKGTLLPDDAQILLFGLHGVIGIDTTTQPKKVGDRDGDGIPDDVDQCPDEPEDKDGFQDEDGCPDLDNDNDGIPDSRDQCPNEPETYNGYADEDGCPDEVQVRVVGDKILLDDRVHFETNRAVVLAASQQLLWRVATLIKKHPDYTHIEVAGYADERGPEAYNKTLSEGRAKAVMEMLIRYGIRRSRLSAVGYGTDNPRATDNNEKAWRENRRTEFNITRETKERSASPLPGAVLPAPVPADAIAIPAAPSAEPESAPAAGTKEKAKGEKAKGKKTKKKGPPDGETKPETPPDGETKPAGEVNPYGEGKPDGVKKPAPAGSSATEKAPGGPP